MTEREIINKNVPNNYLEQKTLRMNEKERRDLTAFLHDDIKRGLVENNLNVMESNFKVKSDELAIKEIKLMEEFVIDHPLWDVCELAYVFETNEEIDEAIKWIEAEYNPPETYDEGSSWIRDFRKENNELDKKNVRLRLPFQLTEEGEEYVDLMEIKFTVENHLEKRVNLID